MPKSHLLLAAAVLLLAAVVGSAAAAPDGPVAAVDAVVLDHVPAAGRGPARVAWQAADGSTGVATVSVPAGARTGDAHRVWVGPDGTVAPPPASGSGPAVAAALTLLVGTAVSAASIAVGRRVRRRHVDGEWSRVEPLWSGRSVP